MGLVPDLLCADFVGAFRISLPHRTSAASDSRLSTREAADSPISESHTSLLAKKGSLQSGLNDHRDVLGFGSRCIAIVPQIWIYPGQRIVRLDTWAITEATMSHW